MPVTLTLVLNGTATDYPVQLTNASGYFTTTLTNMPVGVYTWRAKGTMFLSNSGTFTLVAGLNNVEMGLMKTGDLNADNVTDVVDFNLFKGNFGVAGAQPGGRKGPQAP